MNEIPSKYETFVTDTIKTLYVLDTMEENQAEIKKQLSAHEHEIDVDLSKIQENIEKLSYNRSKVRDIYNSVRTYFGKITYEEKDLKSLSLSTLYNASIVKTTLSKTIPKQDYIPDFDIDIVNLGFNGISPNDDLIISIYNLDADISLKQNVKVGQSFSSLGERKQIRVTGIRCPQSPYEYSINIKLLHEDFCYGELTLHAINIK